MRGIFISLTTNDHVPLLLRGNHYINSIYNLVMFDSLLIVFEQSSPIRLVRYTISFFYFLVVCHTILSLRETNTNWNGWGIGITRPWYHALGKTVGCVVFAYASLMQCPSSQLAWPITTLWRGLMMFERSRWNVQCGMASQYEGAWQISKFNLDEVQS